MSAVSSLFGLNPPAAPLADLPRVAQPAPGQQAPPPRPGLLPELPVSIRNEIEAQSLCYAALMVLDRDSRQRTLKWLADTLAAQDGGRDG